MFCTIKSTEHETEYIFPILDTSLKYYLTDFTLSFVTSFILISLLKNSGKRKVKHVNTHYKSECLPSKASALGINVLNFLEIEVTKYLICV